MEGDLHARLCSLKRYFLLDKGDFLVHFVDIAGEELSRRVIPVKSSSNHVRSFARTQRGFVKSRAFIRSNSTGFRPITRVS